MGKVFSHYWVAHKSVCFSWCLFVCFFLRLQGGRAHEGSLSRNKKRGKEKNKTPRRETWLLRLRWRLVVSILLGFGKGREGKGREVVALKVGLARHKVGTQKHWLGLELPLSFFLVYFVEEEGDFMPWVGSKGEKKTLKKLAWIH
ncbi:hypothetical protein QBC44DRAFT_90943 [Cladorrhinum sp. PSN332]|nr:hypothetical protein QBC44DRAFT_90943 [Cladorrhinum sp. PSN332]